MVWILWLLCNELFKTGNLSRHSGKTTLNTFRQQFGEDPLLFQYDHTPAHGITTCGGLACWPNCSRTGLDGSKPLPESYRTPLD
ncbi:hypothetical protein TNCV_3771541 [Trichonephila clavipes]|nr:hypothetical protein TNCV_3771541 [Trichonephila clavipes]